MRSHGLTEDLKDLLIHLKESPNPINFSGRNLSSNGPTQLAQVLLGTQSIQTIQGKVLMLFV